MVAKTKPVGKFSKSFRCKLQAILFTKKTHFWASWEKKKKEECQFGVKMLVIEKNVRKNILLESNCRGKIWGR